MDNLKDLLPDPLNLIGGRWIPAASAREMEVRSPVDGAVFAAIADSGPEDVDAAVRAARAAFDGGDWSKLTAAWALATRLGSALTSRRVPRCTGRIPGG